MGSYQPKWSGGFTNTFSYKGFTLTANAIYNLGHVMLIDSPALFGQVLEGGQNSFISGNVHSDFLNRWRQPGDEANTNVPVHSHDINTNNNSGYYNFGDINVISASYIKLRDVSLSYSIPDAILQKINASQLSFRVMLNNVMLWKDNNKGIDPEFHNATSGFRSTPFGQKTITFGINLTL